MEDKGQKVYFRKACKPFSMLHGLLMYLVISSTERQHTMISGAHKGLVHDAKCIKATASQCVRNSTLQKISNRFLWHNIKGNVEEFIKKCNQCQRQ